MRDYYVDGFAVFQNSEPFFSDVTKDYEHIRYTICDVVGDSEEIEKLVKETCDNHNREFPDDQPYYYERAKVLM